MKAKIYIEFPETHQKDILYDDFNFDESKRVSEIIRCLVATLHNLVS